ncbi:MAG: hypothetical protein HZA52_06525 [Planctomycetes bacterium]|nr:hypothetical protein [Planctomycetota bacterium]
MIAVLVAGLAGLSLAMIAMTNSARVENRVSKQEIAAQAVAEAGINLAYRSLAAGGSGVVGSQTQPQAYDGATYYVTQTDGLNSTVTLRSTAESQRADSTVEMTLQVAATPLFRWAAFGDDALHMDSNAFVDSFNSNIGSYLSQKVNGSGTNKHAGDEGDVGSNGGITLDSNSKVFGDAVPGPSNVLTLKSNAQVSGASTPATELEQLDPIVLPNVASSGAYSVGGNQTKTLASGTYHYTTFQTGSASTLNVIGPATIICDSFSMKSNSQLLVDATNGNVHLYVVNDFVLDSNALLRSTVSKSTHLQIDLLSDNVIDPDIDVDFDPDNLSLSSNTEVHGTIYAPNAKVIIDSNFQLFGSIVAREVDLDSNCKIHFDDALLTAGPMGAPEYQRIAWRVID